MRAATCGTPYFCVATWAITRLVLSPSVAAMSTLASSTPASSRTFASMPWPSTSGWPQSGPSRERFSSSSSTTVTSQPSSARVRASVAPTRPHPITIAFIRPSCLVFLIQDALGIRDHHHLARGRPQHLVHRRAEEPALLAPPRGGAEEDEVRLRHHGLADDRLRQRPGAHDVPDDAHAEVGRDLARVLDRLEAPVLLLLVLGLQRERHR